MKVFHTLLAILILFQSVFGRPNRLLGSFVLDAKEMIETSILEVNNRHCDIIIRHENWELSPDLNSHFNPNVLFNASVIRFKLTKLSNLLHKNSRCAVAFAYLPRKAAKNGKKSVRILKNMLHVAEKVEGNNLVVVLGHNFKLFKKSLKQNDRKFIYGEVSLRKRNVVLHAHCPNCTQNWLETENLWRLGKGFVKTGRNPFLKCCSPVKGKTLVVSYNGLKPAITRPASRKRFDQTVTGVDVDIIEVVAERLDFKIRYRFDQFGVKLLGRWVGKVAVLLQGKAHIGIGNAGMLPRLFSELKYSNYIYMDKLLLCSRIPIPIKTNYGNLSKPFGYVVWLLIVVFLILFSFTFLLAFNVYKNCDESKIGKVVSNFDFFILTCSTLLEPDPLPWFPKWSTGKILILLWSIFSMMMNFSFNCNLRALLIAVEYEKPVDRPEDVLTRDQTIYIPKDIPSLWPKSSHNVVDIQRIWVEIAALALRTNGDYSLLASNGELPEKAYWDVIDNGASYICHDIVSNTARPFHSQRPNIHISKAYFYFQPVGIQFRKFAPWTQNITLTMDRMVDAGLMNKFLYKHVTFPKATIRSAQASTDGPSKMKLMHLMSGLGFVIIGLIVACLAFLVETIKN